MNRIPKRFGKCSVSFALALIMIASSFSVGAVKTNAYDVDVTETARESSVAVEQSETTAVSETVKLERSEEKPAETGTISETAANVTAEDNIETEASVESVKGTEYDAPVSGSEKIVPNVSGGGDSNETLHFYVKEMLVGFTNYSISSSYACFENGQYSTTGNAGDQIRVTARSEITYSGDKYRFVGWTTEAGSSAVFSSTTDTSTTFTATDSCTIVAKYAKIVKLTIAHLGSDTNTTALDPTLTADGVTGTSLNVYAGETIRVSYNRVNGQGISTLEANQNIPTKAPWATEFNYVVPDTVTSDCFLYYTVGTSGTVEIDFKYYDRNIEITSEGSVPLGINVYPSTLVVNQDTGDGISYAQSVSDAITNAGVREGTETNPTSPMNIGNAIDEYYFWATQESAVDGIRGLTNYHSANASQTYAQSAGDTAYHTDCYGYLKGEPAYMTEYMDYLGVTSVENEKWVTYYDCDGNEINESELGNSEVVTNIVVWGFNTPKDYTVSYSDFSSSMPDSDEVVVSTLDKTSGASAYYSNNIIKSYGNFKYQELLGGDATTADDYSEYYQKVYDLNGVNANCSTLSVGLLPGNDAANDADGFKIKNDIKSISYSISLFGTTLEGTATFVGWGIKDPNFASPILIRLTSDDEYKGRLTSDLNLVACYCDDEQINEVKSKGLVVTRNEKEFYSDDSNDYVRYETTVNTYGFGESTRDIKRISMVYLFIYDSAYDFHPHDATTNDTAFNSVYNDGLLNSNLYAALVQELNCEALNKLYAKGSITIDTINLKGAIFTYDVKNSNSDYNIVLSENNRAMFTTVLNSGDTEDGQKYSDIIVFAAIKYTDGQEDVIALSDNFVRYDDVYDTGSDPLDPFGPDLGL